MARRAALNVDRIVDAAVQVADRGGLDAVSMRNVGKELGVEAMSLYHHLAGKEQLLDAMADRIFTLIELPRAAAPWRAAMAERAGSARAAIAAHPWALGLIESRRTPGPALLAHHDAVLGCLRSNGFPVELATHAFSAIDAYVHGFVLTELSLPFAEGEDVEAFAGQIEHLLDGERHAHLIEMLSVQVTGGNFDYGDEFDFGLGLILDGLAAALDRAVR